MWRIICRALEEMTPVFIVVVGFLLLPETSELASVAKI